MKFKVEKDVPFPRLIRTKYNFEDLKEIGDSFLVPREDWETPQQCAQRVRDAACKYRKNVDPDFYFRSRTVSTGCRIWRGPKTVVVNGSRVEVEEVSGSSEQHASSRDAFRHVQSARPTPDPRQSN